MGNKRVPEVLGRLVLALLAGAVLVLTGPGSAQATTSVGIPAPTDGGIPATVKFYGAVVPQPYNPDPTAYFGDRKCLVVYHDYNATPGCGGFKLDVILHNVRDQSGYLAGLNSVGGRFAAYADIARTFGCLRADGTFDHGTSFVVRTEQQPLLDNYFFTDSNYILSWDRNHPEDEGPRFYVNFAPVQVSCPDGMTATQYGLKVTDVNISIDDPNVFGTTTWSTPGPFYA
ncbi:hypothetical protein [Streptomyces sp. NPDC050535]|uniref:hypothetical protein n=1 Tax=Streptomyces sp. NPDC050535 TaxID=3365626 RepID=UPI00379643EF